MQYALDRMSTAPNNVIRQWLGKVWFIEQHSASLLLLANYSIFEKIKTDQLTSYDFSNQE